MRRIIRLTENDLTRIVKRVIREEEMTSEQSALINKLKNQAKGCFTEERCPCLYNTVSSFAEFEMATGLIALAALTSETIFGTLAFGSEAVAMGGLSFARLKKALKSKSNCLDELQIYLNCLGWEDKEESIDWRSVFMPFAKNVESIFNGLMEYATGDYDVSAQADLDYRRATRPIDCVELAREYPDKLTNKLVQDKKDGIIKDYSYSTKFSNFNPRSGFRPTSDPNEDPYNYIILMDRDRTYCSKKPGDKYWVDATKYRNEIDRVIKDRRSN